MAGEKICIVYKTRYGTTKKYANWLGKDLKAKVFEMDEVKVKDLKNYNSLIVMSGTYAARMPLIKWLKDNWTGLKSKNIIIVAVGAAPQNSWWSKFSYFLIPGRIKKNLKKYFKLPGPYKGRGEKPKKSYLKRVTDYILKK